MTTPLNPQQDPRDRQGPDQHDPGDQQDQHDPTRAVEERTPTTDATPDPTTVIQDDVTQRVETGVPTSPAAPAAAAPDAPWTAPVAFGTPSPPPVPELPRPSGPHAPAIVLGIVCLAMAGLVIAQEVGSLRVDWGDVGPLGIVASGAMLVLFGLLGLMTSRRKQA